MADFEAARDLLQRGRHFERVAAAFELARPGDDRNRQVVAEFDLTGRHNRRCRDVRGSRVFPFSSADHAGPRHQDQPCLTPEYQVARPVTSPTRTPSATSN